MKTDKISILINQPFEQVLSNARAAIAKSDLLLLHEINPQAILAAHQITTGKIRQLLFFHPVYMKQLLDNDPSAVIEVPLKLVLRETETGDTMVSYYDPAMHLEGYNGLAPLVETLTGKMKEVIASLKGV